MSRVATSALVAVGFLATMSAAQNCVTNGGVHMIVARASTEAPGTGIIGAVANSTAQQLPGSDIVAVDYPATLVDYVQSETAGVTAMTKLVTDYAAACPNSPIVLMGYSQGAQVSADVACGASETGFPQTQPLPASISDRIVAIVLMGDPSHVPGTAFDKGSSTNKGVFPRQNLTGCNAVASRMASFCNSGDAFCDSGLSIAVHLSYVQTDGANATAFVVAKAKSSLLQEATVQVSGAPTTMEGPVSAVLLTATLSGLFVFLL
ncbi:acetyl xylanesterase [Diplogelasinospora grovesii]|uniref:Acetyl xylanesterase n=1 Tax=Diplogelasinospora grovesii TaxID=303347 RepID=A0AAN6S1A0_9PEZI|nr:acetyl xylanesterase [Diplogelasinospora grovesii]